MSKLIFIHIPKTGGTTINAAMQGTFWQTEPGFNYRHILKDKSSNSGDLFDPENLEEFKGHSIFMMLRHPIDRLVSEYYFIRERNEFVNDLKTKPKDLISYAQSPQTQNYMTGFLKGKKMYDPVPVSQKDLDDVIESIEKLDIHTGIFEHFGDSLAYISQKTGIVWNDTIDIKRVTLRRPKVDELSKEIQDLIMESNQLDMKLYAFCLDRFLTKKGNTEGNFTFQGDKYDHVIAYAARACFYEFCLNNKMFIRQNFIFFRDLTFYLLNVKKVDDGREFARLWNNAFIATFSKHFPSSKLTVQLNELEPNDEDPLEHAFEIGQTVDEYLRANFSKSGRYKGMMLNKTLI